MAALHEDCLAGHPRLAAFLRSQAVRARVAASAEARAVVLARAAGEVTAEAVVEYERTIASQLHGRGEFLPWSEVLAVGVPAFAARLQTARTMHAARAEASAERVRGEHAGHGWACAWCRLLHSGGQEPQILAEHNQDNGRRFDTAVVRDERQLATGGELATTELVEDLAGSASLNASLPVAWWRARKASGPRAMSGSNGRTCNAVIRLSRPKHAKYHRMPA